MPRLVPMILVRGWAGGIFVPATAVNRSIRRSSRPSSRLEDDDVLADEHLAFDQRKFRPGQARPWPRRAGRSSSRETLERGDLGSSGSRGRGSGLRRSSDRLARRPADPRGFGSASSIDRIRRDRSATAVRSSGRALRDRPCRSWAWCGRCSAAARRPPRRDPRATGNTTRDCGRRSRPPPNPRPAARRPRPPTTRALPRPSPAPARTIRERPAQRASGAGQRR